MSGEGEPIATLRAELDAAHARSDRHLVRVRELEAELAALAAVAEAVVALAGPPLAPDQPLAVRLAWVGGPAEGREG